MPLTSLQPIEMVDNFTRLATSTLVVFDSLHKIAGPSVMEEENALTDALERGRPELIRARAAWRDAIRTPLAHMGENV